MNIGDFAFNSDLCSRSGGAKTPFSLRPDRSRLGDSQDARNVGH